MKPMTSMALGSIAFVIGTAKAMHHTQTADPFAAYWCRPAANAAADTGFFTLDAHCWGCGLAFAGAAMLMISAARILAPRLQAATQRPARLRALEA